ncbi:MAG TPA: phosphoenolpyruvate carboxylase, partial [Gammaproteobacteria bacterium]|nr:phosphoenolpyruvate carboxylase [Gammaproteobacteria bacterium]
MLNKVHMTSSLTSPPEDPSLSLRQDIRFLGEILGHTLKTQVGQSLYEIIETIRRLAILVEKGDKTASSLLLACLGNLNGSQMKVVVRAFSHFLSLANIAENTHRLRRIRAYQRAPQALAQPGSIVAMFGELIGKGITKEALHEACLDLQIDVVFTAHPTEVTRRTIMKKNDHIGQMLLRLDAIDKTPKEAEEYKTVLEREITSIWCTPELREAPPTPLDEVKWGLTVIEGSVFEALPRFCRNLDEALIQYTGKGLGQEAVPVRFSTWMGGDRDGNPNVTQEITRKTILLNRWMAAELYAKALEMLTAELSMTDCDQKMREKVGNVKEPYRVLLKELRVKMGDTKRWIEEALDNPTFLKENIFQTAQELLTPLKMCHASLMACNMALIANGPLLDLIRQVACFGLSLVRLDIRQEASKHSKLMSEITQLNQLGDYQGWAEAEKLQFLTEIWQDRNKLQLSLPQLSDDAKEVWATFPMLKEQPKESLGYYVISMASCPSDVLLVMVLQKLAEIQNLLPPVPLMERVEDLQNAGDFLDKLLNVAWYKEVCQSCQMVMIGYSDPCKSSGILSASWAQYSAQEDLVQTAKHHQVALTLFHGRGGTVGRGGAPAHMAILSQPKGSVNGRLRVTEQGEVIRFKYRLKDRAIRTLELYTSSILHATLIPPKPPKLKWRKLMIRLSQKAQTAYQDMTSHPDFFEYFKTV